MCRPLRSPRNTKVFVTLRGAVFACNWSALEVHTQCKMKALLFTAVVLFASSVYPQDETKGPGADPQQSSPQQHASGVDARGDHAMGFSHETTVHHFLLSEDGGVITVETRSEHDDATRDQIRMHLTHIAAMFSSNHFDIPMFIHDRVPPGVPTMKARHDSITYTYRATERGGQVRITTRDPDALDAVHQFLIFQIVDHRTGDPQVVTRHS